MLRPVHHAYRVVGATAKRYDKPAPTTCEWPAKCAQPPAYWNDTLPGRWYTCPRHTPLDMRQHPIA